MKIKLCGFKEIESLKAAITAKTDFLGFIFHEDSPRNISLEKAKELSSQVPKNIAKVAVAVNPSIEKLKLIEKALNPDFFQLHGQETIEFIQKTKETFPKIKIIKAFNINNSQNIKEIHDFAAKSTNLIDFFLFDSRISGSGKAFDWNLLKELQDLPKDYFLSGGLNLSNIEEALKVTKAKMIDISSGIEISRGEKSPELIKEFVEKVRVISAKK